MGSKSPSISPGPGANDDHFSTSEAALTPGTLILYVLANESRRGTLFSIDDGQVADLLIADQLLAANHSRLGAAIWITAEGRIGYAMDSTQLKSLAAGETLEDSFLYAMRLPNGSLLWSTARVTIDGTNDAPVATWDSAAVAEDGLATGSVAANDGDIDHGAVLSFSTVGALPAGVALASSGTWVFDGTDPAYQSLGAGETLQLTVPYTVTDEHGATSSAALVLTVSGANDAPSVVASHQDGWFAEDGGSMAGSVIFSDEAGDTHGVSVGPVDGEDALGTVVVDTIDESSGLVSWHYELADPDSLQFLGEGQELSEQYRLTIADGHGGTVNQPITITFRGSDDAPVAQDVSVNLQIGPLGQQDPFTGTVVATDPDAGDSLSFFASSWLPGFSMAADGSWTFVPPFDARPLAEGEGGPSQVTYYAVDQSGAADVATLTLNILGANDAPIAWPLYVEATEDQLASGVYAAYDVDNGATLTYAVGEGPQPWGFVLNPDGSWTLDTSHPAYRQLAAGETAAVGVPVIATDEFGASSSSFIGLTVTGVNDAAIIDGRLTGSVTEAGSAGPGTSQATGQLTIVDFDGPANFAAVSGQTSANGYGSFNVTAGGSWTYVLDNGNPAVNQLNGGQGLSDSFAVTAADGTTASVTITIAGASDFTAPVAFTGTGDPVDNNLTIGNSSGVTTYTGTEGPDVITGSWFSDFIDARGGNDTLLGGDGNDQILAGLGNDSVYGNAGGDILSGMGGDDQIWGGTGNDDIAGQDGNDLLNGGSNWDVISGGAGADIITGGFGFDELYGGTGFDTFDFNDLRDTNDIIYDFEFGDMLDFRGIDANPTLAGDQAFGWSKSGPAGHSLWAEQQGASWTIYGDTDGNLTTAEFMVTLQNAGSNFGPNYPSLFL